MELGAGRDTTTVMESGQTHRNCHQIKNVPFDALSPFPYDDASEQLDN